MKILSWAQGMYNVIIILILFIQSVIHPMTSLSINQVTLPASPMSWRALHNLAPVQPSRPSPLHWWRT